MQSAPVCSMIFTYRKHPRNIEAKVNIALAQVAGGFGNKGTFAHTLRVGKVQLKYMAAGFHIKANRQGVFSAR